MNLSPIRIIITGVNQYAKVFRDISRETKRVATDVDQMGRGLARVGLVLSGIGLGLASATGLTSIPQLALDTQHSLMSLGNVGQLTTEQLSGISGEIMSISKETNQLQTDILIATKTLVAAGMDPQMAMRFLRPIGKAATAEQADIADLAKVMFTSFDTMKVPIDDLTHSLDIMTLAGKKGRFELKDMAREFPSITAAAANMGIKGTRGIAQLSAALQLAVKGAANPQEAATNLSNFLQKILSQETMNNFMKIPTGPVNLVKEMSRVLKEGKDPIEEMLVLIGKITASPDPAVASARMSFLFRDKQVLDFLKALVPRLAEYKSLRDEVNKADGEVNRDYVNMMKSLTEQFKQFKINLSTLIMPKLAGPMATVNEWLVKINSNMEAVKLIAKVIIGITALGGALTFLGTLLSMIAAIVIVVTKFGALILGLLSPIALWVGGFILLAIVIARIVKTSDIFGRIWKQLIPLVKLLGTVFGFIFGKVLPALLLPIEAILMSFLTLIEGLLRGLNFLGRIVLPKSMEDKFGLTAAKNGGAAEPSKFFKPGTFDKIKESVRREFVTVDVNMENLPKGTKADAKSSRGVDLNTNMGYSFGF